MFDGVCNFCNDSVNFIIEHDSKNHFRFASLQSEIGSELLAEHGFNPAFVDSIILIENQTAFIHSTAALKIARNLDGRWSRLYVFIIAPKFIRDFCYRLFAKYRYKLFGKRDNCMIPTPEVRERFL